MSQYQKGKTNLDFTEARDSEWQWHQLGHTQVCTSLQKTDNHASTPPLSFLQAGCPSCRPTNSVKALKAHNAINHCKIDARQISLSVARPPAYPPHSTRRTTLGDRAFPVTAARAWNALPSSARSAPSLLQFRRDLKTALHVSVIEHFTIVSSCVTDCNF